MCRKKKSSSKTVEPPQKKRKHQNRLPKYAQSSLERRVTRSSKPPIPYDIFCAHILPMRPHAEIEKLVLEAVLTQNISDLYMLVGRTKATVPSYISSNDNYALAAIPAGAFIMLPVLRSLGFKFSAFVFNVALLCGNLVTMKWLKDIECPWDEETFHLAVRSSVRFDILNWLKQNDCPGWDWLLFYAAAANGSLKTMKWLKQNSCPWNETAFMAAADNGDLKKMKWLKQNDCPWSVVTLLAAAKNGSINNIKWLKANGCPWSEEVELWAIERSQQQQP